MASCSSDLDGRGLADLESPLDLEWFVEDVQWDAVQMSVVAAAGASPPASKATGGARKAGESTLRVANTTCQVGAADRRRSGGGTRCGPTIEGVACKDGVL